MENRKLRVAITHGDTNGIGYEIIFKTFSEPAMLELCTPIIYGSPKVAAYHRNALGIQGNFTIINSAAEAHNNKVNLLTTFDQEIKVDLGNPSKEAGMASLAALEKAMADYKEGLFDVLVTAPINKNNIQSDDFHFCGHTEYIEERAGNGDKALMILLNDMLRVALVTTHLPIRDVAAAITKESIIEKATIFHNSLKRDFRISNPRIAVLALNPHAGDDGLLGREEQEVIIPAIKELSDNGIRAFGPYAADGFFGHESYTAFDGVLAMYHDQGLAPFKCLDLGNGVNFTAGLPIVRTSPDHGTAYDIAGKNMADESSFRNAIYLALDVFRNRIEYDEPFNNPLKKLYHEKRDDSEKARFSINKFKEQDNSGDDKNAKDE
ncbi:MULTISPECIES: 4-hydroxythreonine-4-phosphate dehydrogenase PdxA [Prevotellaceae]|jgi:4-hydroxythreonine-4-phosphate dehydrogenase|uniref:4-hydroxythreonine-4-phosphate dehydrogenase PdxA n=1 Tax=Prevotellaceae TaxID=171552 RepID=UPI000F633785|nr:4-hydroxythreonine-4-phosphate dehydrogenase PdxA [Prevotella marseillensis]HJH77767.1 4-hydroxythreonine-4-phosphate dehydrogenase PdxA [Prevotellaceae bacterium]